MVAYGAEDVIVPPSNARLLASRLPHVVVRRATNAGHAFMFQSPAATATAFTRFLDAR